MTLAEVALRLDLKPSSYEEALGPMAATIIRRMRKGGYGRLEVCLSCGMPEVYLFFTHDSIPGEVVSVKERTISEAFAKAIEQALTHHRSRSGGSPLQPPSRELQTPGDGLGGNSGDNLLPGVSDEEQADEETDAG